MSIKQAKVDILIGPEDRCGTDTVAELMNGAVNMRSECNSVINE